MNRTVRRAQSVVSDQETNDGLAEIELVKLQRQYRIMEGDRKAYSEESRNFLKKQKSSIDQLKTDNMVLLNEIKLYEARLSAIKDGLKSKNGVGSESIQDQLEHFQKKMKYLQDTIHDIDNEALKCEKELNDQRVKMGSMNATQTNIAIQKQIRILENRLDKALIKFNKSLATNKTLRDVIDNLRRERSVFESVYRKQERELNEQKKLMADIIEASNNAYEARDEAQAKMIALKEKAEKEFMAYTQEIKELDRVLEQDRKFKSFMSVKNHPRVPGTSSSTIRIKKDKEKENHKGSQDMVLESVSDYESAFEKIQMVTGVKDFNELVSKFKEIEDQNFSLFNYVNEVNNQVEKTREDIQGINDQIQKYQEGREKIEQAKEEEARDLEKKLNEYISQISEDEKHYQNIIQTFDQVEIGIERLLGKVLSDEPETNAQNDVKNNNSDYDKSYLLKKLEKIETRANDLIMSQFVLSLPRRSAEEKESNTGVQLLFGGLTMQGQMAPLVNGITPPATGEDYDSDNEAADVSERPLNIDELRLKSLKGIAKREKSAGSSRSRLKKKGLINE
ncbi:hypothetical protein O9G_004010 [Rozella allomycis CSF55]|uniref:ODAD1 central coiled coil region domain-containing protein n=1 Tax=Rozella allomycis (strain CSF55) TaxID=988480 RepID=A0A075B187_ROZAC|nr:hypothetical protein O9G_004010 [Rozella allomycis CSF55]|eukprot:EPZ36351.1 hypothetical protein O9G_004010 [Rozella allomycis CSF55]